MRPTARTTGTETITTIPGTAGRKAPPGNRISASCGCGSCETRFFLLLLTGQSVPMIYGGDEFLNSQEGNNNAWCQDNETGWLNWSRTKAATRFREFVGRAAAFRREHPVLRQKLPLRLMDYQACGFPDLSYHGERAWYLPMEEGIPSLGVLLWGPYCSRPDGAGTARSISFTTCTGRTGNLPCRISRRECAGTSRRIPAGRRGSIPRRKRNRRSAERIRRFWCRPEPS